MSLSCPAGAPFALAAALTVVAQPAAAVIDPCLIDEEVRAAEEVVQIEVTRIVMNPNGVCDVSGDIVHVLRGGARPGEAVTVSVQCVEDVEVMCGGTVQNLEVLKRARIVELHLTGGSVAGAGDGFDVIDPETAGTEQHIFNCEG